MHIEEEKTKTSINYNIYPKTYLRISDIVILAVVSSFVGIFSYLITMLFWRFL